MPSKPAPRHPHAFTLIELLVVMAIIGIVIALVVPALGGSRNAARVAATKNQITKITNAISVFGNDNSGQTPGPFTARQMGNAENRDRGMSAAENIMLGLMGYTPWSGSGPFATVGPTVASEIRLDATLIGTPGSESKQYYIPEPKFYVAQTTGIQQMSSMTGHASTETDTQQLPDVVDAFGTPLLFWVADETYIERPKPTGSTYKLGAIDSGIPTAKPNAKYYWTSNACFLTASQLGKKGLNQTDTNPDKAGSMIGAASDTRGMLPANVNAAETSLMGAFGSPNAPYRDPSNLNNVPVYPLSGRAPVIVQSAGMDGIYFSKKDKGAKQFPGGAITYGTNFVPDLAQPAVGYTDKNGKPTNIDVLADFDDIFGYSGN